MVAHIDDFADARISGFLSRVDNARGANKNGTVDAKEAAAAARRIKNSADWRGAATDAFGLAPSSGAELLRFAKRPPRQEAADRILGADVIAGRAEMGARGRGHSTELGDDGKGRSLEITAGGRISVDGKLPRNLTGLSYALRDAARLSPDLGKMSKVTQRRLFATLADAIEVSTAGRRSRTRERTYSAGMSLLLGLCNSVDAKRRPKLHRALVDRLLQGVVDQKNIELRIFYLGALGRMVDDFDPAQRVAYQTIEASTLPKAPPVEEYTDGRTKPLQVRHMIHAEFWKEELGFYSKKAGWKLDKKNAKDTRREYSRTMKDPSGKKAPLKMRIIVKKGELDFFDDMADPKTHVVIYSGHSSLGGNGSQAIDDSDAESGLPKTVFMANCRGKDNYAEFCNKFSKALLITTDGPTYSDYEFRRLGALYDIMAAGESFAAMRKASNVAVWDEPADNYIYPDELRRFFHVDADEDGHIDRSALGADTYFDIDLRRSGADFTRGLAFVNSELFYHWEIDHENGKRSTYGKSYFDHIVPAGRLTDPQPGEVVRVTTVKRKGLTGKNEKFFQVQYDPADLGPNRDLYAGLVTAHTMMAISKDKFGKLKPFETMRAILMGAQAVHYLDVYDDTSPKTYRRYFEALGMPAINPHDIEEIFEQYDAHANNEQTAAFIDMLDTRYAVVADDFVPMAGKQPAYVA